ncbi:MAG: hypothetical protein M3O29_00210 [Actinomycetota bacterium]|nr:hypothetical protein [Actinomycetota bacterium]
MSAKGPVWFQLYVYKDRQAGEALVRRVEAATCVPGRTATGTPAVDVAASGQRPVPRIDRSLLVSSVAPWRAAPMGAEAPPCVPRGSCGTKGPGLKGSA